MNVRKYRQSKVMIVHCSAALDISSCIVTFYNLILKFSFCIIFTLNAFGSAQSLGLTACLGFWSWPQSVRLKSYQEILVLKNIVGIRLLFKHISADSLTTDLNFHKSIRPSNHRNSNERLLFFLSKRVEYNRALSAD